MKTRKSLVLAASTVAALAGAGTAAAHIEPTPSTAPAAGATAVSFTVPHGCSGSATREIAIRIPAGVTEVKPQPKPGWTIAITKGKATGLADGVPDAGIRQISWKGNLPDAYFDTFTVLLGMPDTPGKAIHFPIVQRCAKGVTRWIEIGRKGQPEPDHPAPTVTLGKHATED